MATAVRFPIILVGTVDNELASRFINQYVNGTEGVAPGGSSKSIVFDNTPLTVTMRCEYILTFFVYVVVSCFCLRVTV